MKELIDALTRAANAFAAHYEGKGPEPVRLCKHGHPAEPTAAAETAAAETAAPEKALHEDTPAKEKKARAPKKEAAKPAGGMTEEESTKGTTGVAKLLVSKFAKPVDGKPEGFHIAKKLLIEGFKVGRLSDLSHEQRVQFIAQVKEILLNGAEAPKEAAGAGL